VKNASSKNIESCKDGHHQPGTQSSARCETHRLGEALKGRQIFILMHRHADLDKKELSRKIKNHSIQFAGNAILKIFGRLDCRSGKRMKKENRVFFGTETEALACGFRPCGHCLSIRYREWKRTTSSIS